MQLCVCICIHVVFVCAYVYLCAGVSSTGAEHAILNSNCNHLCIYRCHICVCVCVCVCCICLSSAHLFDSILVSNLYYLSSCGDALATIAASTTFPEPFIVPADRRRLGWVHKSLSGTRCSDHVALLNAFQAWQEARYDNWHNNIQLLIS